MYGLVEVYNTTIRPEHETQFGCANLFGVVRREKVVINIGVGEAVQDSKRINAAVEELTRISGQKPVVTRAKKSIAGFKLREGMPIGVKVTLRRERMFEVLDRSEEHTSELQSLMRISYAVFCLEKKSTITDNLSI